VVSYAAAMRAMQFSLIYVLSNQDDFWRDATLVSSSILHENRERLMTAMQQYCDVLGLILGISEALDVDISLKGD
jgi:hypothetical protein